MAEERKVAVEFSVSDLFRIQNSVANRVIDLKRIRESMNVDLYTEDPIANNMDREIKDTAICLRRIQVILENI